MRKRLMAVAGAAVIGTAALVALPGTAHASNPVPYPASLANRPFAQGWTPTQLYDWGPGSNAPGNCTTPNQGEIHNYGSYVQLSTSGATGDCNDLQSPQQLPTSNGHLYEAKVEFSNWTQWDAFWGYGSNWPQGGEIDAVEGGSGQNFVSYHYQGSNGPAAVSNCNNVNGCDANAGPITKPSNSAALANISPGVHYIDVSFQTCGSGCMKIVTYYDGNVVAQVDSSYVNVLNGASQNDPYWFVFDTGSCNSANNGNVCGSGGQTGGWTKVYYLREFT